MGSVTSPPRDSEQQRVEGWGELRAVTLAAVDDERLRLFHTALLEPAFPTAELMTFEELRDARQDPATRGVILLDGDEPVAGVVTEDHLDGRVLLLAYLVVAAAARSGGLGARLLDEVIGSAAHAPLVLAEIEDPRYFAASDAGDPVKRVRFYDRVGSRLLPIPYVQPSLRPGSPRVDGLLLIAIQAPGPDVDGRLVGDFLDEYYGGCEGDEVVAKDPAYRALRSAALGGESGRLPLLPLSDLDAARPAPGRAD
jgi:GNAT superfamily N-acetyltransferase